MDYYKKGPARLGHHDSKSCTQTYHMLWNKDVTPPICWDPTHGRRGPTHGRKGPANVVACLNGKTDGGNPTVSPSSSRCRAGDDRQNNQFDQFMQWGANIIRKTLITETPGNTPRDERQQRRTEDLETPQAESVSDAERGFPPSASACEESSVDPAEGEDQGESPFSSPDGLDERREEFKHLVVAGAEITQEWPPEGTPTWEDWLQVDPNHKSLTANHDP